MRVVLLFLFFAVSLPCIFGASVTVYNQLGCNPANSTILFNGQLNNAAGCNNVGAVSYSLYCTKEVVTFTKFKVANCPSGDNTKVESTYLVNNPSTNAIGKTCEEAFLWEINGGVPYSATINCTGSFTNSASRANAFGMIAAMAMATIVALFMA